MANTAQATATSGTEITAPRIPAVMRPGGHHERDDHGVQRHLLAHHERLEDVALELADERDGRRPTSSALIGPFAASATTIAMIIAAGAPMSGMKAPMSTSTASGAASGTLEQQQRR